MGAQHLTTLSPRHYLLGATRAEIARVDWVRESGTVIVKTIQHDAVPQLRFFLLDDTEQSALQWHHVEAALLVAYAADGSLLTDSERIHAASTACWTSPTAARGDGVGGPCTSAGPLLRPGARQLAAAVASARRDAVASRVAPN
jgi:hypothetical protein